ncbi:MAG: DNA polymerase III subunit delta [Acidimicrobiales bacterium]|nr:DNA polymerase III subunit delta [Acidimicrobiales bacterium]
MAEPVHLLKGTDDVLRGEALSKLLDELVGTDDRSLVLDEFDLDVTTLGAAVDAAQTPPFLTDRRIVVIRRFGRFSKNDEVAALLDYLVDPLPSSVVVLVWEKPVNPTDSGDVAAKSPRIPPNLTKAVTAAGGTILDTDAPSGRGMTAWVADQLKAAGLDVDPAARDQIIDGLGEDAGSLVGLVERLKAAFGDGRRLHVDDVQPYLGQAGGVPPWELTDAIDSGRVPDALDKLHRMMGAGDRHPLAIMATLQSHYTRMLRLDGAGARSEKDAAAILGIKGSTFPAKKALNQQKRLGSAGVRRAIALLAQADVDLRGARAWPGDLVMEVLVARLARLSR